jgi:uncharacterized protein
MTETPTQAQTAAPFQLLDGHRFMNLTTIRKSGAESTRPVWFVQESDKVYVFTQADSWKAKHIQRNSPQVFVSPADVRGKPLSDERVEGRAAVYTKDHPTAQYAEKLLNRKYGWQKTFFNLMYRVRNTQAAWIEINPAE